MNKSGNTPLIRNDELSQRFGFSILIKDESKNPFGTFKDRKSEIIIKKARDEQVDTLTLITSGNAGYSLGRFSQGTNIRIVNIVDGRMKKSIKDELEKYGEIVEVNLSEKILKPEEVISLVRQNDEEIIWDVTNGFHEGYEKIVEEVKQTNPNFIILPIGSGEAFVGFYDGIKKFKLKTKLIGVGVKDKWQSFAGKLHTPWTPYKSKIQSILKEGHKIIRLEEEEIKEAYKQYKGKFDVEPSSSVVFGVLPKLIFKKEDRIIIVNSGKGIM